MTEQEPAPAPFPDRGDELVVALPHVPVVRAALNSLMIDSELIEANDLLGLGLLQLTRHPGAARGPARNVLQALWAEFEGRPGRWHPTVGRNRILDHVTGVGEISYGGKGSPRVPAVAPSWAARGAGPGQGVRVGVLDTALYPTPWLAGGWAGRYSDTLTAGRPGAKPLTEISGHSTFITGLILGQAPGAVVEVHRVLDEHGTADAWSVAKAIAACGNAGLDVLNLSLVCFTEDGQPPLALATAIDRVASSTVVVAAAGNHGNPAGQDPDRSAWPAWPAALPNVVAVGANERAGDERAGFSPHQPWVDVRARGVGIVSTYLSGPVAHASGHAVDFDGFAEWEGTSFAAGLVSGAIAAGVQPGRVSAHESWADIRAVLARARVEVPSAASLRLRTL